MATIVTRSGKGSALTFAEGDANFTNLNDDKLELTDLSVGAEGAASGDGSIAYNNTTGVFTYTPPDLSSYLTSYTETDPVVGAVNGLVKADGAGNISAAVAGTDYVSSETVTSLSLATNTLSYTDENGSTTNIDLSLYLDDTNLARLTSGTLNASTGIATFTRDDATTFTVDFSALLNVTLADLSVSQNAASGNGTLAYNNTTGVFTYTPPDLSSYLTSYTETDPVVGAVSGIVKADGAGTISAAVAGTDYLADITSESIEDLSDVNAMTPADGDVLTWDNANSRWDAAAASGGGGGGDIAWIALGNYSSSYSTSGSFTAGMLGGTSTSSYNYDADWISLTNTGSPSNWKYHLVLEAGVYEVQGGILETTDSTGSSIYTIYDVTAGSTLNLTYQQYWAKYESDTDNVFGRSVILHPTSQNTYEFVSSNANGPKPDHLIIRKLS